MIIKKITGYPYKQRTDIITGCEELKIEKYAMDGFKKFYGEELDWKNKKISRDKLQKLSECICDVVKNNQIINKIDLELFLESLFMCEDFDKFVDNEYVYFVTYRKNNISYAIIALKTESNIYILNDNGDTIDRI